MAQQPEPHQITRNRDDHGLEQQRQYRHRGQLDLGLSGQRREHGKHERGRADLVEHGFRRRRAVHAPSP